MTRKNLDGSRTNFALPSRRTGVGPSTDPANDGAVMLLWSHLRDSVLVSQIGCRQTDRQTDRQRDRQTDKVTDCDSHVKRAVTMDVWQSREHRTACYWVGLPLTCLLCVEQGSAAWSTRAELFRECPSVRCLRACTVL